jgi:ubiquinone/menaquinone biosynthesis C-methylase UbiE
MMALSKKRMIGQNKVAFINDAIENVQVNTGFDVVATPFLFDNFTGETTQKVFKHIGTVLKPRGLWLNADFQLTGKWWQKVLLQSMFWFFRMVCRIEGRRLPDIDTLFRTNGFTPQAEKNFFGDFVLSRIWLKT